MKTEIVLQAENRRKLVKFLQVEFMALLFFEKQTHYDPDYVAKIPQMEADVQQIIEALSSKETNHIKIENLINSFHQIKSFVPLLQKVINYLVSEKWKPKDYFLNPQPYDKGITIMQADLILLINLLK